MLAVIEKLGNNQGIFFTPEILSQAHISVGDEVFVTVQEGQVIIKPANQVNYSYHLKNLVAHKSSNEPSKKRTVGEYVGKIHISDDFDAPLPDEFWLGEVSLTNEK